MNYKVENITIFEHQPIKVGQVFKTEQSKVKFTDEHLKLLERYRGDIEDEFFPYYSLIHNGVKFKSYVGAISVGGLQIEVLPKTDISTENKDRWRKRLLTMLKAVYKLHAHSPTDANQSLKSSPILDVFLQRFVDEAETLLHAGLIKTYRKETGNRNALKGKMLMNKQITKNIVHKERFYVNYTTYDRNHLFNRILYKTLQMIPDVTSNTFIANRARTLRFEFPELNDVIVTDALFSNIHFDRKSEVYRDAIKIAKLILLNYMPDRLNPHNSVLALMFDMNRLWEEYVYVMLRRRLDSYEVSAQRSKSFWENKTIRPDIVISSKGKKGKPLLVIDTKWKCPKDNRPSDADLKQMYVYHKYWNVNNTVLLYPDTNNREKISGIFHEPDGNSNLCCQMIFVPIHDFESSIQKIISQILASLKDAWE